MSKDAHMTQTLVHELQELFEKIAQIIRANDHLSAADQRHFTFKSASLFLKHESSAQQFVLLTAPGLLVFLRPDSEPFLGVMGRIDFRRGGAAELRALLARLQKSTAAGQQAA
jgi:hypothetical protein